MCGKPNVCLDAEPLTIQSIWKAIDRAMLTVGLKCAWPRYTASASVPPIHNPDR